MSFSIGDTVFDKLGRPGVVLGRDEQARLVVEREGENYEKARRRGFVNGLPAENREQFNKIIDEVLQIKDGNEKVAKLTEQIETLKVDPRNHAVTRYLESELIHVMNTEGIQPRQYKVSELSIRE